MKAVDITNNLGELKVEACNVITEQFKTAMRRRREPATDSLTLNRSVANVGSYHLNGLEMVEGVVRVTVSNTDERLDLHGLSIDILIKILLQLERGEYAI